MTISFSSAFSTATDITLYTSTNQKAQTIRVPASSQSVTSTLSLTAGSANKVTINSSVSINSIKIESPTGKYYASNTGCAPVGYKIGDITATNTAKATISASIPSGISNSTVSKYIEIDYINNDIAFSTSFSWGSNSRNITFSVNGGTPVRLEVPLSGHSSELFSPGLGWWDTATLGILLDGWKDGDNEVVVANAAATDVSQTWGPDFVGLRFYD